MKGVQADPEMGIGVMHGYNFLLHLNVNSHFLEHLSPNSLL